VKPKIDLFHVEPGVQIQACVNAGVTEAEIEELANKTHPMGDMLWKMAKDPNYTTPCVDGTGNTHYMLTPDGKVSQAIKDGRGLPGNQTVPPELAKQLPKQLLRQLGLVERDPRPTLTIAIDDRHIRAMLEMVLRTDLHGLTVFEAELVALVTARLLGSDRVFVHGGVIRVINPRALDGDTKANEREAALMAVASMTLQQSFDRDAAEGALRKGLTEEQIQAAMRIAAVQFMAVTYYNAHNPEPLTKEAGEALGAQFAVKGYVGE